MVIANFYKSNEEYKTVTGLWQYDYGQVLRIQGLDLPPAVEIHFSLQQSGGESITRIGVTKDGVTDAVIPDSLLENGDTDMDYPIYAFVYKSDAKSGETVYRIKMSVKSRPKPEAWSGSGDTTAGQIMEAVNQIAAGKADGLGYKDNVLKLLSGEKEIARVTIKGGSGSGADAREIELQKGETSIQWRYVGDQEWTDLISLEEITGPASKSAYQYAQEGGYAGTEEEFAVLVGKQIQQNKEDISKLSEEIENVSSSSASAAEIKVSEHNVATDAHNDIRLLIEGLTTRLNALADSDDTTLDQMSEIVAYIKSNKSLIDAVTTSKINVSDIIDNLTTNVSNKPLSAAQGAALKALIDGIAIPEKLPNPQKLTFTGAVTGSYDGSAPLSVEIPSGGSGGGGSDNPLRLVRSLTLAENTDSVNINTDDDGNRFSLSECYLYINAKVTSDSNITYLPNGYWVSGTYMNSANMAMTSYPYGFLCHCFGDADKFFGYEIYGNGASRSGYDVLPVREGYRETIRSFKVNAPFASGAQFLLYGRDA